MRGTGVFLSFLNKEWAAYDIEPEGGLIMQANYLEKVIPYVRGRCVIGNPPYGRGNYTSVKFFKKAITEGDFVSFIQPISQLNNNMYMYEFDMVHSEDLGVRNYSGKPVHCVLNIYRRNPNGYNSRPNYDLKDVTLTGVARGVSRNDKIPETYDFSIVGFGGSVGKLAEEEGKYSHQIYFTIHNASLKDKIREVIKSTVWGDLYGMTATRRVKHWMINKRLKSMIPEIE